MFRIIRTSGLTAMWTFVDLKREWRIRRVLKKLSRQRVVLVVNGIWVIERAVMETEETDSALMTCHMRGWIEPIEQSVPHGRLAPDGSLPVGPKGLEFERCRPTWNLQTAIGLPYTVAANWNFLVFCSILIQQYLRCTGNGCRFAPPCIRLRGFIAQFHTSLTKESLQPGWGQ